jgi:hypothetical protein
MYAPPGVSAAIAAYSSGGMVSREKAHGQKSAVRGYPLSTLEHGGFLLKRTNYNAPPFGFDTKKCRTD